MAILKPLHINGFAFFRSMNTIHKSRSQWTDRAVIMHCWNSLSPITSGTSAGVQLRTMRPKTLVYCQCQKSLTLVVTTSEPRSARLLTLSPYRPAQRASLPAARAFATSALGMIESTAAGMCCTEVRAAYFGVRIPFLGSKAEDLQRIPREMCG